MDFEFQVPTTGGNKSFGIDAGSSMFFVGANGGGKTRLAVHIENALGVRAHRIAGHRSLILNPEVVKVTEEFALSGLRFGSASDGVSLGNRVGSRWRGKQATALLSDFDFLMQALFADLIKVAWRSHQSLQSNRDVVLVKSKFELLCGVWEQLNTHRRLKLTADRVEVYVNDEDQTYKADELSDGERSIFYLIGQTLCAAESSVIIFDEPELHLHRAIMSKLWDELEALRPDCAFLYISHDLEFVASREGQKFALLNYSPQTQWMIQDVPEDTEFDEETVTRILGSRRPILFVEGTKSSLDFQIYRCCYPGWTVIPCGGCEEVIHAGTSMKRHDALTRLHCSGVVDGDHRTSEEIASLQASGVYVLPVMEIENIFLVQPVARAIGRHNALDDHEFFQKYEELKEKVFEKLDKDELVDALIARYCMRSIDKNLKSVGFQKANTVKDVKKCFDNEVKQLDVEEIAKSFLAHIDQCRQDRDLEALIQVYDDKSIVSFVASIVADKQKNKFIDWVLRELRKDGESFVRDAVVAALPPIPEALGPLQAPRGKGIVTATESV